MLSCRELSTATFKARVPATGSTAGHLVVRPGIRAFRRQASDADNSLEGRLYNEYALGSRIQYQVRVGEQVFIVEKLRQQAIAGNASTTRC